MQLLNMSNSHFVYGVLILVDPSFLILNSDHQLNNNEVVAVYFFNSTVVITSFAVSINKV